MSGHTLRGENRSNSRDLFAKSLDERKAGIGVLEERVVGIHLKGLADGRESIEVMACRGTRQEGKGDGAIARRVSGAGTKGRDRGEVEKGQEQGMVPKFDAQPVRTR